MPVALAVVVIVVDVELTDAEGQRSEGAGGNVVGSWLIDVLRCLAIIRVVTGHGFRKRGRALHRNLFTADGSSRESCRLDWSRGFISGLIVVSAASCGQQVDSATDKKQDCQGGNDNAQWLQLLGTGTALKFALERPHRIFAPLLIIGH